VAIGIAYLSMFAVLGNGDYSDEFENGRMPTTFDASGGQVAAVISLVAAIAAFSCIVAAGRIRATSVVIVVALVGLLAAAPYALLEMLTWQLTF
jgi:hypothetical protein